MPDNITETNRYSRGENDFFTEEISSIGMSVRPSGSASSGKFIKKKKRYYTIPIILSIA